MSVSVCYWFRGWPGHGDHALVVQYWQLRMVPPISRVDGGGPALRWLARAQRRRGRPARPAWAPVFFPQIDRVFPHLYAHARERMAPLGNSPEVGLRPIPVIFTGC